MNRVVLIKDFVTENAEAVELCQNISQRMEAVCKGAHGLKWDIGEIAAGDGRIELTVSEEKFRKVSQEMKTLLEDIWSNYRRLEELGIVRIV